MAGLTHLLSKSIPTDFFADVDTLSAQSVQIGSDVLFMGYPNFYFDQRNISPILRSGIIATDPQEDFYLNDTLRIANNKKYGFALPKIFPGFLIDGNVFGGSSGSLVFTKPRSSKIEDDGFPVFIISDIPYILGILSDSYFSFEMPQKINLGGVISIKYLIKLLQ